MLTTALAERAVGKSLVLNFGRYIQSQVGFADSLKSNFGVISEGLGKMFEGDFADMCNVQAPTSKLCFIRTIIDKSECIPYLELIQIA